MPVASTLSFTPVSSLSATYPSNISGPPLTLVWKHRFVIGSHLLLEIKSHMTLIQAILLLKALQGDNN